MKLTERLGFWLLRNHPVIFLAQRIDEALDETARDEFIEQRLVDTVNVWVTDFQQFNLEINSHDLDGNKYHHFHRLMELFENDN
jgi:hypothetical protein